METRRVLSCGLLVALGSVPARATAPGPAASGLEFLEGPVLELGPVPRCRVTPLRVTVRNAGDRAREFRCASADDLLLVPLAERIRVLAPGESVTLPCFALPLARVERVSGVLGLLDPQGARLGELTVTAEVEPDGPYFEVDGSPQAAAALELGRWSFDLGTVPVGELRRFETRASNVSRATCVVPTVETSCGVAVQNHTPFELESGASTSLEFVCRADGYCGTHRDWVVVRSQEPWNRSYVVGVDYTVVPTSAVLSELRLEPADPIPPRGLVGTLSVARPDGSPLALRRCFLERQLCETRLRPRNEGDRSWLDIDVRLGPSVDPGPGEDFLALALEGEDELFYVPLKFRVAALELDRDGFLFGVVRSGEAKSLTARIAGAAATECRRVEVDHAEAFGTPLLPRATLSADADATFVIVELPRDRPGGLHGGFVRLLADSGTELGRFRWNVFVSDSCGARAGLAAHGTGNPAPGAGGPPEEDPGT
jgi:hypothetical protein